MKLTAITFLLFLLISLSKCFVPDIINFNFDFLCPFSFQTQRCADLNYNSFYYNEDQQSELSTGTSGFVTSPYPTISIIDTDNTQTNLSCQPIGHGGGNIRGPYYCIIPKNLTVAEPIVANCLFPEYAVLISGGTYSSNVTIRFNVQKITSTSVSLKNKTITINGDALLPREGIATKENGMSIIAKFNNASVIDNLNCKVVEDFKKWICTTNYPQYLSKEFQITYTYQYPTQLKITTVTAIPPPETPTPEPSSSNSLSSIISSPLMAFFLIFFLLK
ncbi:hypothetical protein ACTA71_000796 [Dictyostelium dimigraforme]